MTTEQRILQIEAELASLKADLAMEPPTMERQGTWTVKSNCATDEPAKDWEILEFQRASDRQSYYRKENGRYVNSERSEKGVIGLHEMLHEDACVDSGHYIIHSVRRLSDNSVWTVGDEVANDTGGKGKITDFFLTERGISVMSECFILRRRLNDLKRPTQPLHTTADGIQVTKDQKLYSFLSSGDIQTHSTWEDAGDKYSSGEAAKAAYTVWFVTQDVLSLHDLIKDANVYHDATWNWNQIEAIAKRKLATR